MCMTRMCPVTTDIICHGHESYVSRIIFRVKEFEEKKKNSIGIEIFVDRGKYFSRDREYIVSWS